MFIVNADEKITLNLLGNIMEHDEETICLKINSSFETCQEAEKVV